MWEGEDDYGLGDATADDLLLVGRKVKVMKRQLLELRDVVDMIYGMKVMGKTVQEVMKPPNY